MSIHGFDVVFGMIKAIEDGLGGDVNVGFWRIVDDLKIRFDWFDNVHTELTLKESDMQNVQVDEIVTMANEKRREFLARRK